MPEFATPFSGLSLGRKLTNEELIRAVRFAAAAEFEAVQLYMQIAEARDNKLAKAVMQMVKSCFFSVRI